MVAIKTTNVLVDKTDEKCAYEKFCRAKPGYGKHLRKFGELGTVRSYNNKIKVKLENRGRVCMFVGYAENHSGDVFRMYLMGSKGIKKTRDVLWLGKTYGMWKGISEKDY